MYPTSFERVHPICRERPTQNDPRKIGHKRSKKMCTGPPPPPPLRPPPPPLSPPPPLTFFFCIWAGVAGSPSVPLTVTLAPMAAPGGGSTILTTL